MNVEERPNIKPVCPHCEAKLSDIYVNRVENPGLFGANFGTVYFCPECHKVLGFADYKKM